jgi:protein-S-isoprenylcysteine O-methyltransferase Ste14
VTFNIVAFVTFVPIYASRSVCRSVVFDWWGAWIRSVRAACGVAPRSGRVGACTTCACSSDSLGSAFRQAAAGGLTHRGILGAIRHPWYTGGLCILWVRPKDAASLVTSIMLSLYLVIGAYLEESKLLAEFGDEYRPYQREVSMFLPFRWVRARFAQRGGCSPG